MRFLRAGLLLRMTPLQPLQEHKEMTNVDLASALPSSVSSTGVASARPRRSSLPGAVSGVETGGGVPGSKEPGTSAISSILTKAVVAPPLSGGGDTTAKRGLGLQTRGGKGGGGKRDDSRGGGDERGGEFDEEPRIVKFISLKNSTVASSKDQHFAKEGQGETIVGSLSVRSSSSQRPANLPNQQQQQQMQTEYGDEEEYMHSKLMFQSSGESDDNVSQDGKTKAAQDEDRGKQKCIDFKVSTEDTAMDRDEEDSESEESDHFDLVCGEIECATTELRNRYLHVMMLPDCISRQRSISVL